MLEANTHCSSPASTNLSKSHRSLKFRPPSSEQHQACPGTNPSGYLLPTFHGSVSYKNKIFAGRLHNTHIFRTGQPKSKHIPLLLNTQTLFNLIQNSFKLTGINANSRACSWYQIQNQQQIICFTLSWYQSVENGGLASSFAERTESYFYWPSISFTTQPFSQTHGIQIPYARSPGVMCKSKLTLFSWAFWKTTQESLIIYLLLI